MLVDAVHGIDNLKAQLRADEAAVAEARAEADKREAKAAKTRSQLRGAEERLRAIAQLSICPDDCNHDHGKRVAPYQNGVNGTAYVAPDLFPSSSPKRRRISLTDETVPKVWRIAFMLYNDEVLDYRRTAEALWGNIDKATAKNRISSNLAFLRNAGIIEPKGSNRFTVNAAKLAEKSGIPVVEEGTP
jgi:hypothetical protein